MVPEMEEFIVLLPMDRQARLLPMKDRLLDHLSRAMPHLRFGLAHVPALQELEEFVVVPIMGARVPGKDTIMLCRDPDPRVLNEISLALSAFEGGRSGALNSCIRNARRGLYKTPPGF
jgi:hypothetical protein